VQGKVVTRFPPEPSGYLHIGHAKAALLNYTYAQVYGGKMLLRFDDTNPTKEKQEYQDSILEDLKALGIKHEATTYTSDYIDFLAELMTKLIKEGKAYCDDTDADTMKDERRAGTSSKCRGNSVEENLRRWKEILAGSEEGLKNAVRGKLDMQCLNMCMRDPVFYRCKVDVPHHRHGTKYKAYPTYDYCCAVVDAKEGVTHALRSLEYSDRAAMYEWVLNACGCQHVELTEFSRMNMDYTVLSKRKLTKLVDEGIVTGWDDPRMPTVRGVLRRGLTVEALKEFVMTMGASRNTNSMSWDKIWAINKQRIDPIVPRFCAMEKKGLVKLTLTDGPAKPEKKTGDLHPKNPDVGKKDFFVAREVYLKQEDCKVLKDGEEITLMAWGNAVVEKLEWKGDSVVSASGRLNLEGSVKSTKYKLNWLPVIDELGTVTVRELGFLFSKPTFGDEEDPLDFINRQSLTDHEAFAEPAMAGLKKGDMLQLVRGAYYICDSVKPTVLIEIPDGKAKKVSGEARDAAWQGSNEKGKGAKDKEAAKA
jgi:glutamyl-tRNA synthetase